MAQESGIPRAQGRNNDVITDLRRSVVAESSAKLSPRSPYRSKGDKSAHLRPSSPRIAIPSIAVSPNIEFRKLPESPRIQITPLQVSADARRSRLSSNGALSGRRELVSSTTHAISSPGAAAVVASVASSYVDDSLVTAQESPRVRITPLQVSVEARRSQLSPYEVLSGKREWSSSTSRAISSSSGTAAVLPAVASGYADDSPVAAQESPRIQITPLQVSVEARRSQLSPNGALSGKQELYSSTTHAISLPGAAAVVPAVASNYVDDSPAGTQESPHIRITPLQVSVEAHRSRLSPYEALSGKREWSSSTTHVTSSSPRAAVIFPTLAPSCANDSPVASPSHFVVDPNEDDRATTRSPAFARTMGTMRVQEKSKAQCLPDITLVVILSHENRFLTSHSRQPVGPTVVANARPGIHSRLEYVELDERVPENIQPDITVEGSWALKPHGGGRGPSTAKYGVGRDDTRGMGRGYLSIQDADIREIEKSAIQSSHGDMVQIQPSETDDDASVSRSVYREPRWAFYCFAWCKC